MKHKMGKISKPAEKSLVELTTDAARKLKLSYNFACIKYILDIENISIGQLRCAQFFNGTEYYFDLPRATYYLVLAGLIGSGQEDKNNTEQLEEHTYKILDDWMEKYDIWWLYVQLINQLEERHFFVGSATLEVMKNADSMSLSDSWKDCIQSMLAQEIMEKLHLNRMKSIYEEPAITSYSMK